MNGRFGHKAVVPVNTSVMSAVGGKAAVKSARNHNFEGPQSARSGHFGRWERLCAQDVLMSRWTGRPSDRPRPIFKHRGGPVDLFDENRLFLTLPSGHCQCSTAICNLPIINYSK